MHYGYGPKQILSLKGAATVIPVDPKNVGGKEKYTNFNQATNSK